MNVIASGMDCVILIFGRPIFVHCVSYQVPFLFVFRCYNHFETYRRSHTDKLLLFFLSEVAAGQVINRLQFTWTAIPARNAAESARAFVILFYITVAHWILFAILEISVILLYPTPEESDVYVPIDELPKPTGILLSIIKIYDVLKYAYFLIVIVIVFSLRKSVRAKFGIPGSCFEDCCCAFWCNCLVVGQMLRHTTDYDVYPSQLCSSTGLSSTARPMIV